MKLAFIPLDKLSISKTNMSQGRGGSQPRLIENLARLDADEVTQWMTFTRLVNEGRSVDEIATDRVTVRHLALASKCQRPGEGRVLGSPVDGIPAVRPHRARWGWHGSRQWNGCRRQGRSRSGNARGGMTSLADPDARGAEVVNQAPQALAA